MQMSIYENILLNLNTKCFSTLTTALKVSNVKTKIIILSRRTLNVHSFFRLVLRSNFRNEQNLLIARLLLKNCKTRCAFYDTKQGFQGIDRTEEKERFFTNKKS